MDHLRQYRMFVEVADHGSFIAAARELGESPQALTRGIGALEGRLGTTLLRRSTRAVALTDAGAALLPETRRLLEQAALLERSISRDRGEPVGQLHVTAPVMFGRLHVLPVINRLIREHPALDVRLLLLDRNVRMIEEGIDVAVRIGRLADSTLRAREIGRVRDMLVASPDYLARRGVPLVADHLRRHDLIASTGPRAASQWRSAGAGGHALRARLHLNTIEAALDAVRDGIGIASFISYQVADAVERGELVEVLRPEVPVPFPVTALFDASRASIPAVRALVDGLAAMARGHAARWA